MSDEKKNGRSLRSAALAALSERLFSQPQTAEFLVHFMRNERCTSVPLRVFLFRLSGARFAAIKCSFLCAARHASPAIHLL